MIPLYRAGGLVTGLLGSFGHGLRETRLTAALGYVISVWPEALHRLFDVQGAVHSVSLEHYHERDRSDIFVGTSGGDVVIEAKVSAENPRRQVRKYPGAIRVILSQYLPSTREKAGRRFRYATWQGLADRIGESMPAMPPGARFVCQDMIRYMEEHHMSRTVEPVEVYAREINEEPSFRLFLHGGVYFSVYKANSRLSEALYFAPHFGQRISRQMPGIHVGISYIAKIEAIEITETWADIMAAARGHRGKAWLNRNRPLFQDIPWTRKHEKRYMLLLDEPQLVFNPPVRKENLQGGRGFLSKHFFSFNELFKAWKEKIKG